MDGYNPFSTSTSVNPSESNSEWLTRKRLIDPKLKAAGWKIVPFSPEKPLNAHEHRLQHPVWFPNNLLGRPMVSTQYDGQYCTVSDSELAYNYPR